MKRFLILFTTFLLLSKLIVAIPVDKEQTISLSGKDDHNIGEEVNSSNNTIPPVNTTKYKKQMKKKIENLEKLGVQPKIAKEIYLKHLSNQMLRWREKNPEKAKKIGKTYSIKHREDINNRKRIRYKDKWSKDSIFVENRKKEQKEQGKNTIEGRFQAKIRNNIKQGLSESEAKEEAQKYMNDMKEKTRLRAQKRRQNIKNAKTGSK